MVFTSLFLFLLVYAMLAPPSEKYMNKLDHLRYLLHGNGKIYLNLSILPIGILHLEICML